MITREAEVRTNPAVFTLQVEHCGEAHAQQLPFLVNPVQGTVIVRGGMQGTWIVFEVADGRSRAAPTELGASLLLVED